MVVLTMPKYQVNKKEGKNKKRRVIEKACGV